MCMGPYVYSRATVIVDEQFENLYLCYVTVTNCNNITEISIHFIKLEEINSFNLLLCKFYHENVYVTIVVKYYFALRGWVRFYMTYMNRQTYVDINVIILIALFLYCLAFKLMSISLIIQRIPKTKLNVKICIKI